jgi:hypothetical protein
MAAKDEAGNPFQGIPGTIQLDNGPVGKSAVFRRVMDCPTSRKPRRRPMSGWPTSWPSATSATTAAKTTAGRTTG